MTKGDKMMKNIAKICAVCGIMVLFSACGNEGDFDAMGIFEADEVLVSAEVSGKIIEFSAVEGVNLAQGDVAVKIDSTQIALNTQKLELQLQNASAAFARNGFKQRARNTARHARKNADFSSNKWRCDGKIRACWRTSNPCKATF